MNRMPPERVSITHRFVIRKTDTDLKGYITVGLRADGQPGEMFIRAAKLGGIEAGLLHALAVTASMALQHGVPVAKLIEKWRFMAFEPGGITGNQDVPMCRSVVDYLAQWLEMRFMDAGAKL